MVVQPPEQLPPTRDAPTTTTAAPAAPAAVSAKTEASQLVEKPPKVKAE